MPTRVTLQLTVFLGVLALSTSALSGCGVLPSAEAAENKNVQAVKPAVEYPIVGYTDGSARRL